MSSQQQPGFTPAPLIDEPPKDPKRAGRAQIHGRRPAPAVAGREISVFVGEPDGSWREEKVRIGRPTVFDEMMVVVGEGVSLVPTQLAPHWFWPMKPRDVAREVLRDLKRGRATLGPPLRDSRILHDARWQDPNNMAHLILDILPFCMYVQETLGEECRSVFYDLRGPFKEVADRVGLRHFNTPNRIGGRLAKVRGTRGLSGYDVPLTFDVAGITMAPNVYDALSFEPPFRAPKIYIARRSGGRSLKNAAQIEPLLEARGYRKIYLEDYSVLDQLGIAHQAEHVVSTHGAGMALLAFARGIRSVVEILPPHCYHQYFAMCLDHKVEQYAMVLPANDERLVHEGYWAFRPYMFTEIEVDPKALSHALDHVGG